MPVFVPAPPTSRSGTFPGVPLGATVDLQPGGTWAPITGYVKLPVTVTRGRADGSQQATACTAPMTWDNTSGRFAPRNPAGPWYGLLGRNTPVRLSVPAASTYLRFADDAASSLSAPDSVGLSVTGDLEVQIDLDLTGELDAVDAVDRQKYAPSSSWPVMAGHP